MPYNISIIHPSRNRPRQANKTIKHWLSMAKDKSKIEYILSVDKDDKDLVSYKHIGIDNGIYVASNRNKSAIQAINNAAKVSTANIIIVVSDDFTAFQDWDEILLKELEGKEDFVVKTRDGIQDWIITLPLMDRTYYRRFGYIYYPGFQHLWSDSELFCVAWMMDKIIMSDLVFEHHHYSVKKSKKDLINIKNDKTWKQGEKLFYERKKSNFELPKDILKKEFPYFAGFEK